MHVCAGVCIKVEWSYAEKCLLTFLFNLSSVCPDTPNIFFNPCSFIFRTLFYLEQSCDALLNFSCKKMILRLSIHQAWWLGNIWKKIQNIFNREAENKKQCFLLVTIRMHDEFIVIPTSQLSAILHTVVTQAFWLSLTVQSMYCYKTTKYHGTTKKGNDNYTW